jgi:hypothetical protein
MPAKSRSQQKAAGAALSAKRGDTPKSRLKGPARQMVSSMSEKERKWPGPSARESRSTSASRAETLGSRVGPASDL